jgi:hypothetical protein
MIVVVLSDYSAFGAFETVQEAEATLREAGFKYLREDGWVDGGGGTLSIFAYIKKVQDVGLLKEKAGSMARQFKDFVNELEKKNKAA